ncbi:hypothetical protein AN1V17_39890 [Vallitalea sediminicola]
MPFKIALDATEFVAHNARKTNTNPIITFFGGEPLLKWKEIIVPLTSYIRNKYGNNFDLSITTNGLLLDEEKLKFMKKNNIDLLLSMDGNKKTQDLNRPTQNGNSSFDILYKKLTLILKYYPDVTFRSTTDHDNASEFVDNHKFAINHGFKNVYNIVNVFSHWNQQEKQELKVQIDKLGDYYIELLKANKSVSFMPFMEMFGKLNLIEDANKNNRYRDLGTQFPGFGRCGIGATMAASVGIDGKLYSCQELVDNNDIGKEFTIGNIYAGADNKARYNIFKDFNPKKVICSDGIHKCNDCKLNPICDGACLINNYFKYKDLHIMPSTLCFYYQELLKKAFEIKKIYNQLTKVIPF